MNTKSLYRQKQDLIISRFIFFFSSRSCLFFFFFFNDTATTEIYTLSLHDALPISRNPVSASWETGGGGRALPGGRRGRAGLPPGAQPPRRRPAPDEIGRAHV